MKKFRFRLQRLLRLRQEQEDARKRAVGTLLGELNEQQRQAVEMAGAVRREGEKLKEQYRQGAVDLDWVGHYRRYVSHMQQAISKRIETVAQIQQRLLEARQKLAQAAQQTKILEKLKDKRQSRYEAQLGKQQQREEDELGVKMFAARESWA